MVCGESRCQHRSREASAARAVYIRNSRRLITCHSQEGQHIPQTYRVGNVLAHAPLLTVSEGLGQT